MRFSTVASSAILFSAAALAAPGYNVVYETEVATVTSCKPEVTDCPGNKHPEVPAPVYPPTTTSCTGSETPVYTPPAPVYPPVESHPAAYPPPAESHPVYPSGSPESPEYPTHPSVEYPVQPPAASTPCTTETPAPVYPTATPVCPGGAYCPPEYVPTGTGYPTMPHNTSSPQIPTYPPVYTGAASAKSFSLVAVIAAAGAFFLA